MTAKHKVLIAEEDENITSLLELMFDENFEITIARSGTEALRVVQQESIDFAILDTHLSEVPGIEICKKLKENHGSEDSQIIMISEDNTESLVKQAYELGVGDYITKPFDVITFRERVMQFSRDLVEIRNLKVRDMEIRSVAETAMKQASSYGGGLELMSNLNKYDEIDDIAREVMGHFSLQGIMTSIQFRHEDDAHTYDVDTDEINTIELQVFDLLKDHGRIYHFGKRTIFNSEKVSMLVKNMPAGGTPSYDAILDLGAKILPAIEARYESLIEHNALLKAKSTLISAIDVLGKGLENLEKEKVSLLDNIALQITLSFHKLDLDEEQEKHFVEIIEQQIGTNVADQKFMELQVLIEKCLESLPKEKEKSHKVNTTPDTVDVELF
jgi:DNA-binding response OmpR family regulator